MQVSRIILVLILGYVLGGCNSSGNQGELAKYQMINAATPVENLITGGQPSIEDLKLLASEGVKVIVNLRTKGEFKRFDEQVEVEKLGMKYVSIEIEGSDGMTEKNAQLLDFALNNLSQPALVHCASSNRVGGLLALRAFKLHNMSAQDAISFGKRAGMSSTEKRVRKLLGLK